MLRWIVFSVILSVIVINSRLDEFNAHSLRKMLLIIVAFVLAEVFFRLWKKKPMQPNQREKA